MLPSRSQLLDPISSQIERAWHLFTILIRFGRPARSTDLASRLSFDSVSPSPDLLEFLCRIPGSPLFLTEDRLITVSEEAVAAFSEFLASATTFSVPRVRVRIWEERRGDRRDLTLMYVRKKKSRPLEDGLVVGNAKRRLLLPSERDVEESRENGTLQVESASTKTVEVHNNVADILAKENQSIGMLTLGNNSGAVNQETTFLSTFGNFSIAPSSFGLDNDGRGDDEFEKVCDIKDAITVQKEFAELSSYRLDSVDIQVNASFPRADTTGELKIREHVMNPSLFDTTANKPVLWMETMGEDSCILTATPLAVRYEMDSTAPAFLNAESKSNLSVVEYGTLSGHGTGVKENAVATEAVYRQSEGASFKTAVFGEECDESMCRDQTTSTLKCPAVSLSAELDTALKQQGKSLKKPKPIGRDASTLRLQGSNWEQDQSKRNKKDILLKEKMKNNHTFNMSTKENMPNAIAKVSKNHLEHKLLPEFESFITEEEEGSGGYGTVFRARRKEDGKLFAIKCPHPNAHVHHVTNELKMLERFGGRSNVIKYEGSFRNGESECFVLEHVEHDRPEVLKKEIDVFELRWYGYCMFRALASLHKQGIAHRDVKPGNFLFSRKLTKGYLIDFNLATDLNQKFFRNSRSRTTNVNLGSVSVPIAKSSSYSQARKVVHDDTLGSINKEVSNGSRKLLILKNLKARSNKIHVDTLPSIDSRNNHGSQAADISGVTSAKDPTSTRTPSADRIKQPVLYQGRRELLNFVHELQSPNHDTVTGPSSQRKRVAAPLGRMDRKLMILTPMPLHSGGNAIAGSGMFDRGKGKQKREGPCVGTKGFRAPEVLFKSYHQSCKIDVWSAGVTLLYLIIGRTPFGGDPEQNIKEIAKLRGSEDLWEVAKLHDCEPSFPADLFDVQSLQSTGLRDWCVMNTRRPEFLELVPKSFFDLVDKCLIVNPRLRITAEDALMHDFFTPCHESLRKHRLLRRIAGSGSGSQTL